MKHPYLPITDENRKEMLEFIGVDSVNAFFADIPQSLRFKGKLNLPEGMSQLELTRHMTEVSSKNATTSDFIYFLGAGTYDHYIPATVDHVISRSELYTAYTPYQAEMSQGVLQSIYEYQSLICDLTGMEVSNASLYDGATAVPEAAIMACRSTRKGKVLISAGVHPEYIETLNTYAPGQDIEVITIPLKNGVTDLERLASEVDDDTAAVFVQSPNFVGLVEDMDSVGDMLGDKKTLFVAVVDPISLGVLKAPGEYNADIAIGEGQALGNPMYFGGPHLGFFATKEKYQRQIAGRVAGATTDGQGNRGFVLTLQTREQHIRRERATSNICSNEALNALAAATYLSTMGKEGMKDVAELNLRKAHYAQKAITRLDGFDAAFSGPFFKEFVVKTKLAPAEINKALLEHRIIGGLDLGRFYPAMQNHMLFCVTEKRTKQDIDYLAGRLEGLV